MFFAGVEVFLAPATQGERGGGEVSQMDGRAQGGRCCCTIVGEKSRRSCLVFLLYYLRILDVFFFYVFCFLGQEFPRSRRRWGRRVRTCFSAICFVCCVVPMAFLSLCFLTRRQAEGGMCLFVIELTAR